MKPPADAALERRSALRAARAARRRQDTDLRREFRRFTTPGGLQVQIPMSSVLALSPLGLFSVDARLLC